MQILKMDTGKKDWRETQQMLAVVKLKDYGWVSFILFCGMGDLSSRTRDRTRAPLQWKRGVLTTGPPGKSHVLFFILFCIF